MRRCALVAVAMIFLIALVGFAIAAAILVNDMAHPSAHTGCVPLPPDFNEEQLLGTWVAQVHVPVRLTESLTFSPDGTYSQVVDIDNPPAHFEGQPRRWSLEFTESGIAYLHMEDMLDCGVRLEPDCDSPPNPAIPWADVCQHRWFPSTPGELVLTLKGFAQAEPDAPRQFHIVLFLGFEAGPWVYGYQP